MTDRAAFLQAIVANPDEDAPRLIFADWLEEQGDGDQAEFIRIQCELARLPGRMEEWAALTQRQWDLLLTHPDGAEQRATCTQRQWDLLFLHTAEWRQQWLPGRSDVELRYGRGLPVALLGTAVEVAEALAQLHGQAPIQELEVHKLKGRGALLAECAGLDTIRRLKVIATVGLGDDFLTLLRSPHLTNLQALACVGGFVQPWTLQELVRVPQLRTLRTLELSSNHFANEGMAVLVETVCLPQLTHLDMSDCSLSDRGVDLLCRQQSFPSIERLNLGLNRGLGNPSAQSLAAASHWPGLRALHLHGTTIGAAGAVALARAEHLESLELLDLRNNHLPERAAATLRRRFGSRVLLDDDQDQP